MNRFEAHFTVHGILTTFAEVIEADAINRDEFRKILNARLAKEGYTSTVNEIFFIRQVGEQDTTM